MRSSAVARQHGLASTKHTSPRKAAAPPLSRATACGAGHFAAKLQAACVSTHRLADQVGQRKHQHSAPVTAHEPTGTHRGRTGAQPRCRRPGLHRRTPPCRGARDAPRAFSSTPSRARRTKSTSRYELGAQKVCVHAMRFRVRVTFFASALSHVAAVPVASATVPQVSRGSQRNRRGRTGCT